MRTIPVSIEYECTGLLIGYEGKYARQVFKEHSFPKIVQPLSD